MTVTLVGTGEIETKYGLTRLHVFRLIKAGDWPEPVQEMQRGRLWDAKDVAKRVDQLFRAGRLRQSSVFNRELDEWEEVIEIVAWGKLDEGRMRPWAKTMAGSKT